MSDYTVISRGDIRDRLGEGLFWSARDDALFWTDILGKALNRLSLGHGQIDRWIMPEMIGWVIGRQELPGLIAGLQSGFAELTLDPLTVTFFADPEPEKPHNRLNDAKADGRGRIWAGSMPVDADKPSGGLYRLDPDRSLHHMDQGYIVANGPAISADQRWLYHTDTGLGVIYRFALESDGSIKEKQEFIRFEKDWGKPDGMTIDADGGLWVAHWGGGCISRFDPGGKRERRIALPVRQITNICFAGDGLDRMFVTSAAEGQETDPNAGALFEIDAGVRGLPPGLFGG